MPEEIGDQAAEDEHGRRDEDEQQEEVLDLRLTLQLVLRVR